MSDASEKLLSGRSWHEFCDRLRAVGDMIMTEEFPQDSRGRTEGFRYLTRLLSYATRMEIESGDPLYPVICRYEEPHNQWGGPNPDNTYLRAVVHPDHAYRVWGNLSGMREAIFSLHEGDMQLQQYGVYSEQTLKDYFLGPNGGFELWISKEKREGNWMPMHEAAHYFQVRIYLSDWANDTSPTLHIERVGAEGVPPPPIEPAALAAGLERSVHWVEKSAAYWNQYTTGFRKGATPNQVSPAAPAPGGADNILYGTCSWDLNDDEAIVMEYERPEAKYWSFCSHTMNWLESGDMANRQVSLNGDQVHVDDDGRIRVVLAGRDPGVPNWIDTAGRRVGLFVYRWVWARTNPCPDAQLVKVDAVRELMPEGHPVIDEAERRKRLAARREQYWNRYI